MSKFGVTIQEAKDFILQIAQIDAALPDLYNLFLTAGLTNAMVAEIVGAQSSDVIGFFASKGIDSTPLDSSTSTKTTINIRDTAYTDFFGKFVKSYDASGGAYEFVLDTTVQVNGQLMIPGETTIYNFGADDSIIALTGDRVYAYAPREGYGDGADILIGAAVPYSSERIKLVGIYESGGIQVSGDVADFNLLPVGDIFVPTY